MKKAIIRLFTAFCLCFTPMLALALSGGTTIDMSHGSPPAAGTGWTYAGGLYTINNGADVTVIGSYSCPEGAVFCSIQHKRLAVANNATATITLNNVSIDLSGVNNMSPLFLGSGANVVLYLESGSTNTFEAGAGRAGIETTGAELTISGGLSIPFPKLTVTGGNNGAGIGGSNGGAGGKINIRNQVEIIANGGVDAAGIGGGRNGAGGTITISKGLLGLAAPTVTATGAISGAGIGGGYAGAGGVITISNGRVTAKGGAYGAGIGGGGEAGASGTIAISGGTVTATGGDRGAGIGAGYNGVSSNIAISGDATVTATGGAGITNTGGGAGIGSGGTNSNTAKATGTISINTSGTVTATGGAKGTGTSGAGAAIGQGGYVGGNGAPVLPAAPQSFTAAPGNTQVALSWGAPTAINGIAFTGYSVSRDNGANWTDVSGTTHTFTGLTNGTAYDFQVRARFNNGFGLAASVAATPLGAPATAPSITSANGTTVVSGTASTFQVTASGSPTINYTLGGTVPAGVSINNSTGLITIAATTAAGSHDFNITATNSAGSSVQGFTLTVQTAATAPVITSANSVTVASGTGGAFQVTSTGGVAPITYSLNGQPTGVTINSTTGLITIAAATAQGNHGFVIRATDNASLFGTMNFTLIVGPSKSDYIQRAYIAFFNRPADVPGMSHWMTHPGDMRDMLNLFSQSAEYLSDYAGMSNDAVIKKVYMNLFGREPEPGGLNFWTTQMSLGHITIANVAYEVLGGAQNEDKTIIENKVKAANMFTTALNTPQKVEAYNNAGPMGLGNASKTWLATVNETNSSLSAASSQLNDLINQLVTAWVAFAH